jgi:hypothetical protein
LSRRIVSFAGKLVPWVINREGIGSYEAVRNFARNVLENVISPL